MTYPTSKVLGKAAAVLDHLAMEGRLAPGALAEMLGEPRASVYRLLAGLERFGFVERSATKGEYRLGTKILWLADALVRQFDVRDAARPILERLGEETGLTVFLCIRRGYEAVCIDCVRGRWIDVMAMRPGSALPLHVGAAPRALMAFEGDEFVAEYAAHGPLVAFTPSTPVTREALVAELAKIRNDGYGLGDEDVVIGLAAITAPIFDHEGKVIASLSATGARQAVLGEGLEELCGRVRNAGRSISSALGYVDVEQSAASPKAELT